MNFIYVIENNRVCPKNIAELSIDVNRSYLESTMEIN